MEKTPCRWTVCVCLIKIKRVCLDVQRNHILLIKLYDIKRRVLKWESGQTPCKKVDAYVFSIIHALSHLNIFSMSVAKKSHSNNILEPIHQPSESMSPSMSALFYGRQMSYYDCLSTNSLNWLQFTFKPRQLISRVIPVFQQHQVQSITGLSVYANDVCVATNERPIFIF